jgi:hypothetical protein
MRFSIAPVKTACAWEAAAVEVEAEGIATSSDSTVEGIAASAFPTVGAMRAAAVALEEDGIAAYSDSLTAAAAVEGIAASAVGAAVKGRRPDAGVGVC